MVRTEYYEKVQSQLKYNSKLPMAMEVKGKAGWMPLNLYDEVDVTIEDEYRLTFKIGNVDFIIGEKAFDKYYLPMIEYESKADVEYKDIDVEITVNNLRYAIIDKFQKYFLQP